MDHFWQIIPVLKLPSMRTTAFNKSKFRFHSTVAHLYLSYHLIQVPWSGLPSASNQNLLFSSTKNRQNYCVFGRFFFEGWTLGKIHLFGRLSSVGITGFIFNVLSSSWTKKRFVCFLPKILCGFLKHSWWIFVIL